MAFVFEPTPGLTTSNSYASIDDLDTYFGGRFEDELWTALDTTQKEKIAVTGTRRLDQEQYTGIKTLEAQALQFPREPIFDRDGYSYDEDAMPDNLKYALGEYIYFVLQSEDRILSELDLFDAKVLDGYAVGPLDWKFNGKAKMNQLPQTVKDELTAIGDAWVGDRNPSMILR